MGQMLDYYDLNIDEPGEEPINHAPDQMTNFACSECEEAIYHPASATFAEIEEAEREHERKVHPARKSALLADSGFLRSFGVEIYTQGRGDNRK